MRIVLGWLAAMVVLGLPAAIGAQSMSDCRATPQLLELGAPLTIARTAVAERKQLRILTISSSATESYGVSNPAYAYPAQLGMGLQRALPGIDIDVVSRGIGGQDLEEMAARVRVEMMPNLPSLVVWQTGTTAAMHHMPLDAFEQRLRMGIGLGKSLGADFVLMTLQSLRRWSRCRTRKSTSVLWHVSRETSMSACFAATTSCEVGTMTACHTPSSSSSTDCISTILGRSALASCSPSRSLQHLSAHRPGLAGRELHVVQRPVSAARSS